MSLLQLARQSSGDLHAEIERTPLAISLAKGTVDRTTYAELMFAMSAVHAAVEANLDAPPLAVLDRPGFRREETARADAFRLALVVGTGISPVVTLWHSALENREPYSPWVWAGALYVLEGSKMGSRMLIRPIASALGVPAEPGQGLDYHLAAVSDKGQSWAGFKAFLESAALEEDDRAAFAEGVRATFAMMAELYADLTCAATAV